MKRSKVSKWLSILAVSTLLVATWTTVYAEYSLVFDPKICTKQTLSFDDLNHQIPRL